MDTATPPAAPPAMPEKRKNWFLRNMAWFIPVCAVSLAVLVAGFIALFFFFILGVLKSAEPYRHSLDVARNSPAIVECIGQPVEEKFWFAGNIETDGSGTSHADYVIPLKGPGGKGVLYVKAVKQHGEWEYQDMTFKPDGGDKSIDLLENKTKE